MSNHDEPSRETGIEGLHKLHPDTLAATALGWINSTTDAIASPIHPSTSFLRDPENLERSGRLFTRDDNPTYDQPEALINQLEGGIGCLLFSSGMAAITSVFNILEPGDHIVLPAAVYSGLRDWLNHHGKRWGLKIDFLDSYSAKSVERALRSGKTKIVWVETPSNPTWSITDIRAISKVAHNAGAIVAIDNTVSTPILTRPIKFGADIVLHSGSKYMSGHGDLIAGALVVAPGRESLLKQLKAIRNEYGSILGTFESWLLLRGMRTLAIRVKTASANALSIAIFLKKHHKVLEVLYPGLESHKGHDIAKIQMMNGYGGMLSFRLKGGESEAKVVAGRTRLIRQAISFGSTETVIEHRAGMEGMDSQTPCDLLRISVGIENLQDLIADLRQALDLD